MLNVKLVIWYRTDSEQAHQSVRALLDNSLPYMVDSVSIDTLEEED